MLYDPKWEKQITRRKTRGRLSQWFRPLTPDEVFDLSDFTAWVATKPMDETYSYIDPANCALAQYLQSRGVTFPRNMVSGTPMRELHPLLPSALNDGAYRSTFGSLRDRLLALA